jgi:hypothetical protein
LFHDEIKKVEMSGACMEYGEVREEQYTSVVIMLKEWNLNAFQNSQWTIHPEEQDPLDSRS